jgi:hypothetical protein
MRRRNLESRFLLDRDLSEFAGVIEMGDYLDIRDAYEADVLNGRPGVQTHRPDATAPGRTPKTLDGKVVAKQPRLDVGPRRTDR